MPRHDFSRFLRDVESNSSVCSSGVVRVTVEVWSAFHVISAGENLWSFSVSAAMLSRAQRGGRNQREQGGGKDWGSSVTSPQKSLAIRSRTRNRSAPDR